MGKKAGKPILIRDIDALPNLRATLPGDRNEMPEAEEV
jgi:hypothetical protein